jgi:hypothetical protein
MQTQQLLQVLVFNTCVVFLAAASSKHLKEEWNAKSDAVWL